MPQRASAPISVQQQLAATGFKGCLIGHGFGVGLGVGVIGVGWGRGVGVRMGGSNVPRCPRGSIKVTGLLRANSTRFTPPSSSIGSLLTHLPTFQPNDAPQLLIYIIANIASGVLAAGLSLVILYLTGAVFGVTTIVQLIELFLHRSKRSIRRAVPVGRNGMLKGQAVDLFLQAQPIGLEFGIGQRCGAVDRLRESDIAHLGERIGGGEAKVLEPQAPIDPPPAYTRSGSTRSRATTTSRSSATSPDSATPSAT